MIKKKVARSQRTTAEEPAVATAVLPDREARAAAAKARAAARPARTRSAAAPVYGGVGDTAVRRATGKSWREWNALLDHRGGRRMEHPEIARLLHTEFGCSDWWSQMITVGYEQARGLRAKHQKPSGFEISRSLTIGATPERIFEAWSDGRVRRRWLPDRVVPRTSTPGRSVRLSWGDSASRLEARFTPKPGSRCQVTVQHGRLPDAMAAERMKTLWGRRLAALKALIEGPGAKR